MGKGNKESVVESIGLIDGSNYEADKKVRPSGSYEQSPKSFHYLDQDKATPSVSDSGEDEELYGIALANKVKFTVFGYKITEKYYMLCLFTLLNLFLYADQNLLAPNLTVIAREYNFTKDERDRYIGGYIPLGFFLIGGISALVIGYLADKFNRKIVFAAVVFIGEFSCAMTYFVPMTNKTDFWTGLFLTRSFTGLAIGGAVPIQFSIIGDMFGKEGRGKSIAFFQLASGAGMGIGQYIAGQMSPDFRTPFLLVSVPAFGIIVLFLLTAKEPKRGQAEELLQNHADKLKDDHVISKEKFYALFGTPTILLSIVQGLPGTLPWGVLQVYLNDFLLEEKDMKKSDAANLLLFFGFFTMASNVLGGLVTDRFIKKKPKVVPLVAGFTTMLSAPMFLILIKRGPFSLAQALALIFPSGIIVGMAGVMIKSILLEVTIPETRGSAFALHSLLDELGKGLGPIIISAFIEVFGERESGLFFAFCGWVPCGIIMCSIACFIEKDIRKAKLALAEAYDFELSQAELEEIEGSKVDKDKDDEAMRNTL